MRKTTFKSKKAFTLVELMIAIGIIILLFALSINSLIRSRMSANEAAAIKTLKTLHAAFASYRIVNPTYPANLTVLASEVPPYIDNLLAEGTRQGYDFEIFDVDENTFRLCAEPVSGGITGNRIFYIDESGEIIQVEWEEPTGPSGAGKR